MSQLAQKSRGMLIAGNWKMNQGPKEAEAFFEALQKNWTGLSQIDRDAITGAEFQIRLFVPFLSLASAQSAARRFFAAEKRFLEKLAIGAQNAHWEKKGAFTGEISGPMLQEIEIHSVLIGHSERRQYFGENDQSVFRRTGGLLEQGFEVMTCIGETQAEREAGQTENVLSRQISGGLGQLAPQVLKERKLTVAYEPVWAIGTGLSASPAQAQEAHLTIRRELARHFGQEFAARTLVLYGGSVTPDNLKAYLECPDIDGALVGGASLKPEGFLQLLKIAANHA